MNIFDFEGFDPIITTRIIKHILIAIDHVTNHRLRSFGKDHLAREMIVMSLIEV